MAQASGGLLGDTSGFPGKGKNAPSLLGNTATAYADDMSAFLHGQQRGVQSSNVAAGQYNPQDHYLQLGFKNGGWYGYHDVSAQEAASFYSSKSKGSWVWDHLRVRGTVFGYQKPYAYIGGRSQDYTPKYYNDDTHREQHRHIAPAGDLPEAWNAGNGPYRQGYGRPEAGAEQHPMGELSKKEIGAIAHRKVPMAYHAPREEPQSPATNKTPPEPLPTAKPATSEAKPSQGWFSKLKSLFGSSKSSQTDQSGESDRGGVGGAIRSFWGSALKSLGHASQHKAQGGEVEQRLGSGGDDEPIQATPGEGVIPKQDWPVIKPIWQAITGKSDSGGQGGHFASGGTIGTLLGGFIGNAIGGPSGGALGASFAGQQQAKADQQAAEATLIAAKATLVAAQAALAAGTGSQKSVDKATAGVGKAESALGSAGAGAELGVIGLAVAAAKMVNDQFDKLAGGLGDANRSVIDFGTGFAQVVGVPKGFAELGGAVFNLVSPLKAAELGVKAMQFAMMPILNLDKPGEILKDVFKSVADAGSKMVGVLFDLRDPSALLSQSIGPFVNQISRFNPAAVDRMNFALDNLTASAGRMFEPIVPIVTGFADELNRAYTAIGEPVRGLVGQIAGMGVDVGRELFASFFSIVQEGLPVVRGFLDDLRLFAPTARSVLGAFTSMVGGVVRVGGAMLSGVMGFIGPIVQAAQPLFGIATEIKRVLGELWQATEPLRQSFLGMVGYLMSPSGISGAITGVVSALQTFTAAVSATVATLRRIVTSPTTIMNPGQMATGWAGDFQAALARMQAAGGAAQLPGGTAQTMAAREARHIGIEEVGLEARRAAYSQGQDIQQNIAANTLATAEGIAGIWQWIQAQQAAAPAAPAPSGGM